MKLTKKALLTFVAALVMGSAFNLNTAFAQQAENPSKEQQQAEKANRPRGVPAVTPTRQPDRIILNWSDNSATTQSVTWRASSDVMEAFGEIVAAGDAPTYVKDKQSFPATCEAVESNSVFRSPVQNDLKYNTFSVTFTGLQPETTYSYRVGQCNNWSEWHTFTTASTNEKPFTFLYFGDAQNGLDTVYPRLARKAFLTAPEAKFAIFTGDLVGEGSSERDWDNWFQALGFLAANYPLMMVPGNHEHDEYKNLDGTENQVLTKLWKTLFTLPQNGPENSQETCYTFTYNGVRFIALDSAKGAYDFRGEGAIAEWLEPILKDNKCQWTILYFHHPLYSSAKDRNHFEWRQAIKPLIDRYHVDLVLSGHDHVYSRTSAQTPSVETVDLDQATELDAKSNTVYLTSVAGEKMYELQAKPFFVKSLPNTQLFQTIHIDGGKLTVTSLTATGKVIDSFVLEK